MTAWQRPIARSAWAAFLVLFVVRAVAGAPLCEFIGERGVAAELVQATAVRAPVVPAAAQVKASEKDARVHERSDDGSDHVVCEDTVFGSVEPQLLTATKGSLKVDVAPGWPTLAGDCKPVAVVAHAAPRQWLAQPPPSRSPLDTSPRLRL